MTRDTHIGPGTTLAIMQPYFMPYLGYFQLIQAVDTFVFYDDVSFINRGWINRNRILVNGMPKYITIPLVKASQNKLINEIEIVPTNWRQKMLKSIRLAYGKAPYFDAVFKLIEEIIDSREILISDLAISSVSQITRYLGIEKQFKISSKDFAPTVALSGQERILKICKEEGASMYINPTGGRELYDRNLFEKSGIDLRFIESVEISYHQFGNKPVMNLSIIDVLMFNSKEEIRNLLSSYQLT